MTSRSRTFRIGVAAVVAVVTAVVSGVITASVHDAPNRVTTVSSDARARPVLPAQTPAPGLGTMIRTSLGTSGNGEWVIKAVPVKLRGSTKTTFGFAMNERAEDGALTQRLVSYELTAGAALNPGFHAVAPQYSYDDGLGQPAYGYYVGPVATVTGAVDGGEVVATMAKWSVNTKVTVFWFDNTVLPVDRLLRQVTAYDAGGRQVTTAPVSGEGN